MKKALFLTILILTACATTFAWDAGLYAGMNYSPGPNHQTRLIADVSMKRMNARFGYDWQFCSLASVTERSGSQRTRVSANPLFLFAAIGAKELLWPGDPGLPMYMLLSPITGNFRLQYYLLRNRLFTSVGQNTDFYLPDKPSNIFTASVIGAEYRPCRIFPTRITIEVHFPWVRGYLDSRAPNLFLGVSLMLSDEISRIGL